MLTSFSHYLEESVGDPIVVTKEPLMCSMFGTTAETMRNAFVLTATFEPEDFHGRYPYKKPVQLIFLQRNLYAENRKRIVDKFPLAVVAQKPNWSSSNSLTQMKDVTHRKWEILLKNYFLLLPLFIRNNGTLGVYGLKTLKSRESYTSCQLLTSSFTVVEYICAGHFYGMNRAGTYPGLAQFIEGKYYADYMNIHFMMGTLSEFDLENTEAVSYAN